MRGFSGLIPIYGCACWKPIKQVIVQLIIFSAAHTSHAKIHVGLALLFSLTVNFRTTQIWKLQLFHYSNYVLHSSLH